MLGLRHGELPTRRQFVLAWSRLSDKSYHTLICPGKKPLFREGVWEALVEAEAIYKSRKSSQEEVDEALQWTESVLLQLEIWWV
jgi:hypothetical protein